MGMTMTYTELEADLRARWLPSPEQIERADKLRGEDEAYTCHLLVNKEYGFWTEDVELVALDGVFLDRASALLYLETAARTYWEANAVKVTGGYSNHYGPSGCAAVYEDICSEFPKQGKP